MASALPVDLVTPQQLPHGVLGTLIRFGRSSSEAGATMWPLLPTTGATNKRTEAGLTMRSEFVELPIRGWIGLGTPCVGLLFAVT